MYDRIISADSHVAETEAWYEDIDPKFRDRRPRNVDDPRVGAAVVVESLPQVVPLGMICTAGRPPEKIGTPMPWAEVNPAGYDSATRLATQDQDGVVGEVIFPSVGMLLVLHPDADYKKACFDAYNRHLVKYCSINPQRLIGVPQVAIRTIDEGIQELEQAKAMGFKAVMVPGEPIYKDYDHPDYDAFYEAAVALELPLDFHILTTKSDVFPVGRGPHICGHQRFVRGNQDIISMLVFSGVFERHPKLRIVSVESDASWIPHYGMRMDAAYNHHRYWEQVNLSKMPSAYLYENVYFTIQDDHPVGKMTELLPMDRIMFASDFPHSDGIWPHSKEVADRLTKTMSDTHARMITHDNVAKLYGITV
ncbi:MAG: amidohydrolase [Deltaproteobacteria bacterium]|nr:amidohydrolase [Deltaproteobacteria bacterium]